MSESEFNRVFSENLRYYLELRGKTQAELAKFVGVSTAAVNTWCKGLKNPRMDKTDKICAFLNCSRSDLIEDRSMTSDINKKTAYYLDAETAAMAQELFDNPEYRMLFDAARNSRPEDLQMAADMLTRLKKTNPDG